MMKQLLNILFLAVLLAVSGCSTIPAGNKSGSLVDAGEKTSCAADTLTEQGAENAFIAAFIIWKIENGVPEPVLLSPWPQGRKLPDRFRNGLTEAGAVLMQTEVNGYLLEEKTADGQRIFTLKNPSGTVVLLRSYRIRKESKK